MLLNFNVFFYALCVCLVLNLLSSLVPVWNASRKPIVDAINS
jgi:putative ABC transport system permease protein